MSTTQESRDENQEEILTPDIITSLADNSVPSIINRQAQFSIYNDTIEFIREFLQKFPDKSGRVNLRVNAAIVRIIEEESNKG